VRQVDVGNIIHPTDPNGLVVVTQIEPISLDLYASRNRPAADPAADGQPQAATVLALQPDDKIELDQGKVDLINMKSADHRRGSDQGEFPNTAQAVAG
jgi:multidrug efflux system membrane fusion protein